MRTAGVRRLWAAISSSQPGQSRAAALQAGTVWVNTWMLRDLRAPFGGVKASGVGREGGEDSREFFTEAKTICLALD